MLARVDAEFFDRLRVGGDGREVAGDRRLRAELADEPRARGGGIGHGLERGEGFGRDDEQCLRRIEIVYCLAEGGPIDIGDETEVEPAVAVAAQGLIGHLRAEIRPADADIHDVADALSRVAGPRAVAHLRRERRHAVEHRVHAGDDVLAIDLDHGAARSAQGDVQHRAAFGRVDLLAAEHGVAPRRHAAFLGETHEQLHRSHR